MARPHDVTPGGTQRVTLPPPADGPSPGCPFCPGAEAETPPEVWALRNGSAPDTPGWRVRAVPNRYPVVTPPDGLHEVIVNADRHVSAFWDLTGDQALAAVRAWVGRESAVAAAGGIARTFLFLNQGAPAGASLQHSHAQLVGLATDPPRLAARERAFAGDCPICADLADPGGLLVAEGAGMVAWCPAVPPITGVVRIAPSRHAARWTADDAAALAPLLRGVMRAAAAVSGTDAANLWVHVGRPHGPEGMHWHLEVVPRIGTLAGLELGAGVYALVADQAERAMRLREALTTAR